MASMPLAFGLGLAGAVLLDKGIPTLREAFSSPPASGGVSTSAAGSVGTVSTVQTSLGATTNPVPGAKGTRLDQGFDGTTQTFLAPFAGRVVYSTPSDPGWNNGGYVAIAALADASKVYYAAEGLTPTVHVGQTVSPGQVIATPRANPYNGTVGNYEIGWADPNAPGRPLAQVAGNRVGEVMQFYSWIRSLGGPTASSTSSAGYP